MSLEVTYGNDDPNFRSASGLYIGQVTVASSSDPVNPMQFEVKNDGTVQELVISVPQQTIGGLAVYSASSSIPVLTTYVGDSRYVITPEYFGIGTYDIIMTSDPNNCSSQSLVDCINGATVKNSGEFEVVGSNQ
jgi:hypothetical protein